MISITAFTYLSNASGFLTIAANCLSQPQPPSDSITFTFALWAAAVTEALGTPRPVRTLPSASATRNAWQRCVYK